MKVPKSHTTERAGLAAVERIVTGDLGWLFREQPISDFGVDAEIEIVDGDHATGRLIAAQIKTGPSYFREASDDGFVFRGDLAHLEYWLNHSLPVIVVLCNTEAGECLWAPVSKSAVAVTDKGWCRFRKLWPGNSGNSRRFAAFVI